ncbi:MAG: alpha/beta family hydrolase [Myxococcota bacterium]
MEDAPAPEGFIRNGPSASEVRLVLAHGAGAPMDSDFMNAIASAVGEAGISVVRFEFEYMSRRRQDGKRRGPDRAPKLMAYYRHVVEALGPAERLVIGGKSMGGRIASMIADEAGVRGLVCLGYPFHPPGRPERLRTAHLERLRCPTLIVQGDRDRLGNEEEVAEYSLSQSIEIVWLPDGDHSFKPRKKSGHTESENLRDAVTNIVRFVSQLG